MIYYKQFEDRLDDNERAGWTLVRSWMDRGFSWSEATMSLAAWCRESERHYLLTTGHACELVQMLLVNAFRIEDEPFDGLLCYALKHSVKLSRGAKKSDRAVQAEVDRLIVKPMLPHIDTILDRIYEMRDDSCFDEIGDSWVHCRGIPAGAYETNFWKLNVYIGFISLLVRVNMSNLPRAEMVRYFRGPMNRMFDWLHDDSLRKTYRFRVSTTLTIGVRSQLEIIYREPDGRKIDYLEKFPDWMFEHITHDLMDMVSIIERARRGAEEWSEEPYEFAPEQVNEE